MTTLGIDLSTIASHRAMALLHWGNGRAAISELATGHPIDWLAKRAAKATWTAIDAPFGWPDRFIETIVKWAAHGGWPLDESRDRLRYRLTDLRVSKTKYPLSVSSDRIGSTAMVCAQLLDEIARARKLNRSLERTGSDRIIECYPAASMKVWEPEVRSFKGKGETAVGFRRAFLERLTGPRGWLALDDGEADRLIENEDLFDALICSLVARAVWKGPQFVSNRLSDENDRLQAEREGWIYLPAPETLDLLAEDS